MYSEVIKTIMSQMHILPRKLLIMYLVKKCNISESVASNAVHAAWRNRDVWLLDGDLIALKKFIEFDSEAKKRAKAFRVYLEFIKDSNGLTISSYPWSLTFNAGVKFVQVCNVDRDMELTTSMSIKELPVEKEDREYIRRIAILEPGCAIQKIKKVGFIYYCSVSDDYTLKIIQRCDEATMWDDIPG